MRGPVVGQAALHGLLAKVRDLGMPLIALGKWVTSDPTGRTRVPGVWAAGNVADPAAFAQMSNAARRQSSSLSREPKEAQAHANTTQAESHPE